jgi:type IV secretion system protein VirB6
MQDLISCKPGLNTQELDSLCFYDKGRGMVIKVGSNIIKTSDQSFVYSDLLKKDFLYYRADSGKELDLDIGTDWQIDGMLDNSNNFKQLMTDWSYRNVNEFSTAITNQSNGLAANFLHFGRYIMQVEIGNGDSVITPKQQNIQVEYTIVPKGADAPSQGFQGTNVSHDFSTNAESDGDLYIRVINPDGQGQGSITVNIANYTGTTWFSDIVAGKIVIPLRDNFQKLSKQFYVRLAGNATMKYISKVMLTLYVILYGLFFLAGVTKISVRDIVIRIVKISIVVALFSEHSWNFFNNNLFQVFVSGSDYLFNNVVGLTSSKNNIFGFVDPIFDKYTNSRIWGLLFIQLLQIHNGLTFFALMAMCSILLYFRAVLEVIIGYVLAFLGLSVMIGLAPFFITFMLFERTKSFFTNWISVLFNYMIQPTILLVFFLLIDQIMSEQLAKAVVRSCWDILISIKINLDLNHIGIPLNIPFTLPFLPGIPFYVPAMLSVTDISNVSMGGSFVAVATSSLLFYAYCLMANGLVSYVTTVISYLTNVQPARLPGKGLQSSVNPTESIMQDMQKAVSPVTNVAKSIGKGFKERVIDQKYGKGASEPDEDDKKSYSNEIRSGSRHDVKDDDSGIANTREGTRLGGKKDESSE